MSERVLTLTEIPIGELYPSPSNPRRHFDQAKLQELAASIVEKGVLEPILVREKPNGKARYEIVAGDRRHRGAQIAGLATLPCIIRELTDVEVLEVQTIENLQRDDLHPLEEADGYAQLMKRAGYDAGQIAQKVARSEKYVYDRVKLLQLTPQAKKIFLDGEISAGHAILLARLSPKDQARAIGTGIYSWRGFDGGVFEPENADDAPGLELDDRRKRKPVSVRELDTWINDNVRFKPEEVDLPNLFPDTAVALQVAAEDELKVVKITYDYRVPDAARDEKERTYGEASWKRADGAPDVRPYRGGKPKQSKTCEHSVMGVVVAGPGRGEAFRVCVAKKKCEVHWRDEMREAARREKEREGSPRTRSGLSQEERWERERQRQEEERKRRDAEQARWRKAGPALRKALIEKLKKTPAGTTGVLADIVLEGLRGYGRSLPKDMPRGRTAEDLVRYCAFFELTEVLDSWRSALEAPKAFGRLGINAKKIVDEVAPPPKPEGRGNGKPVKKGARPKKGKRVQTRANA